MDQQEAACAQSVRRVGLVRLAADRLGGEIYSRKAILVISAPGNGCSATHLSITPSLVSNSLIAQNDLSIRSGAQRAQPCLREYAVCRAVAPVMNADGIILPFGVSALPACLVEVESFSSARLNNSPLRVKF